MAEAEQKVAGPKGHVQRVVAAFKSGNAIAMADIGPVCARVVRGSKPEHFVKLSKDAWKRFSWCIGADGLEVLLRDDLNLLEKLRLFGFTDKWLEAKLKGGERFRLAVFPATNAPQATWEGIFKLVQSTFPSVSKKVMKYKDELQKTEFEAIQSQAPFHPGKTYYDIFEDVDNREQDENFITLARLEKIENPELWEVRGFLYNWMGLKELFDGCGCTKSETGEKGMNEYLTPNVEVKEIQHLEFADFNLTLESFYEMQKNLAAM